MSWAEVLKMPASEAPSATNHTASQSTTTPSSTKPSAVKPNAPVQSKGHSTAGSKGSRYQQSDMQRQPQQSQQPTGAKSGEETTNAGRNANSTTAGDEVDQSAPQRRSVNVNAANSGINLDKFDDATRKILASNAINPIGANFNANPDFAKFYVIKSYSEDDVHKSIKYSIWTSTDSGNRRLDKGYKEFHMKGPVYLCFSVNASGQFCGIAQMMSPLDYSKKASVWNQEDKWNGQFEVKWIFIKDVPNSAFRHIRLTNNENKPVTNSRDTQEVLLEPGREILKIFKSYKIKTSILDDFSYYNQQEEQERITREAAKRGITVESKQPQPQQQQPPRKLSDAESQQQSPSNSLVGTGSNATVQSRPPPPSSSSNSGRPVPVGATNAPATSKQTKPKNLNKAT